MTGSHANDLLEAMRQVTLAAEADLRGYLGQWPASLDQSLRLADAHTFQIGIRRHAYFVPKYAQQVIGAEGDEESLLVK